MLKRFHEIVARAPDAEPSASPLPAGDDAGAAAAASPAAPASPAPAPRPSTIFDLATPDAKPAEGYKAPDRVPEHLRGVSADDTFDKVMKAYEGARKEISKGLKPQEAQIPETIDAYKIDAKDDNDRIATELASDLNKPIVDAFREAARAAKVPPDQFATFMREGIRLAEEAGYPITQDPKQTQAITAEAEMSDLVKTIGAPAAGTVVNTTIKFIDDQAEAGVITEAEANELRVAFGTSASIQAFYKVLTGFLGHAPIPMGQGGDGQITTSQANAAYNAALALPDGPERANALAKADELMLRAYGGDSPTTGSVRSNVL